MTTDNYEYIRMNLDLGNDAIILTGKCLCMKGLSLQEAWALFHDFALQEPAHIVVVKFLV